MSDEELMKYKNNPYATLICEAADNNEDVLSILRNTPIFKDENLVVFIGGVQTAHPFEAFDYIVCKDTEIIGGIKTYNSRYQSKPPETDSFGVKVIPLDVDYSNALWEDRRPEMDYKTIVGYLEQTLRNELADTRPKKHFPVVTMMPHTLERREVVSEDMTFILTNLKLVEMIGSFRRLCYFPSEYGIEKGLMKGFQVVEIDGKTEVVGNIYLNKQGVETIRTQFKQIQTICRNALKCKTQKQQKADFATRYACAKGNGSTSKSILKTCLDNFVQAEIHQDIDEWWYREKAEEAGVDWTGWDWAAQMDEELFQEEYGDVYTEPLPLTYGELVVRLEMCIQDKYDMLETITGQLGNDMLAEVERRQHANKRR